MKAHSAFMLWRQAHCTSIPCAVGNNTYQSMQDALETRLLCEAGKIKNIGAREGCTPGQYLPRCPDLPTQDPQPAVRPRKDEVA
eukprot:3109722-Pyramimonas_sp.AAC.3